MEEAVDWGKEYLEAFEAAKKRVRDDSSYLALAVAVIEEMEERSLVPEGTAREAGAEVARRKPEG